MPQVKIHIPSDIEDESKRKLVQVVRELIPTILNIDEKIGQVMLYESRHRATHLSRDNNFVFIEITMYIGRSFELKEKLADTLIAEVQKYTNVGRNDINLVYYELTPENYFGGTTHKYIEDLRIV
ncbi:MAG: hypothetical protein A2Y23_04860 [Clostridiales bacterium GWB2_37_7]|nr:MAG: hypothetical protein A2Y23_04860 [Clostridiales bacterium GWB2_37_7]